MCILVILGPQGDHFSNTHQPLWLLHWMTRFDNPGYSEDSGFPGRYRIDETLFQELPGLDTQWQQASQQAGETSLISLGKASESEQRRQVTLTKSMQQDGSFYMAPIWETLQPIPPRMAKFTDLVDAQASQARHGTHREGTSSTFPSQGSGRLRGGGLMGLGGNPSLHLSRQRLPLAVSQVTPTPCWQLPGWGFSYLFQARGLVTVRLESIPFRFSSVPTTILVSQSHHNDSSRPTPL